MNIDKKYLSPAELSIYLGYHRETIYKMCRAGEMPHHQKKRGRRIFFIKDEIDRWIEESDVTSTSPGQTARNILNSVV